MRDGFGCVSHEQANKQKPTDTQTDTTHTDTDTHADTVHTDAQTHRNGHTDTRAHRHTGRQTADTQTKTHRHTQKHTHTHKHARVHTCRHTRTHVRTHELMCMRTIACTLGVQVGIRRHTHTASQLPEEIMGLGPIYRTVGGRNR